MTLLVLGTSVGYAQINPHLFIQGSLGGASGSLSGKGGYNPLQNLQLSEVTTAGPWWDPDFAINLPDRTPGVGWLPYKMNLNTALQGGLHIGSDIDLHSLTPSTSFTAGLMIGGALMSLKGQYTPSTLYAASLDWGNVSHPITLGYNPPVGKRLPESGNFDGGTLFPFSCSAPIVSFKGKGYGDATMRLGIRFDRFHVVGNLGLAIHKITSKFLTTQGDSISMKTGATPCLLTGGGFTYNITPSFGFGGTINTHFGSLKIKSPQKLFTIKQRFRALESMITFNYTLPAFQNR